MKKIPLTASRAFRRNKTSFIRLYRLTFETDVKRLFDTIRPKSNDFSFRFLLCDFFAFFASLREIKEFFSRKSAKDAKEERYDKNSLA